MRNFNSGEYHRQKDAVCVSIQTVGAESFDAHVYITHGARLTDMLNDERAFIPAQRADGKTMIIAKSHILSILDKSGEASSENDEDEQEFEPSTPKKFDPYVLLRIDPAASVTEIRAAYKARIKAVHPDSIAALGLDEELTQAALRSTQKINYAYRKIMREREPASKDGHEKQASA